MVAEIKNFYLNNLLPDPEYMKIHISAIPKEIIDEYILLAIFDDKGFYYIEIVKGMYGIKQAGIITHQ